MNVRQALLKKWPKFRRVAGVDIRVKRKLVEAVLADSIRGGISSMNDASSKEMHGRLAVRASDWEANKMGPEMAIRYRNRFWRIGTYEAHDASPYVFFDIVAEA